MCFHEDVQDEAFDTLSDAMVVTISVHVVPTVKQLLNLKSLILWIAYLIINDSRRRHDSLVVEGAVGNVDLLSVSQQIVNLVHIDTISRIRHYLVQKVTIRLYDRTTANQPADLVYVFFSKSIVKVSWMTLNQVFKHNSGSFLVSPEIVSPPLFVLLHLTDEVVVKDMAERTMAQIVNQAGKSHISNFFVSNIEVWLCVS